MVWSLLGLLCLPSGMPGQAQMVEIPELGLRVAPGFRVTLYADHDLAADSYAMTLDAHGRVVVTSQGYIRILHDRDGDGRADVATSFANTTTGGMGLCFDGNDLYFAGDGALLRFRDADGNGEADAAPERLVPLNFAEHGGHAMRKGPDGWWYLIGGNDTGFTAAQHISLPHSAVAAPEGGAVLRLTPDASQYEIFAHGFRNPYDFDFHWLGDLFTYDSDVESDMFLPWYTPTRIYHIAHAGHHNWRLPGWRRSWNRADYYLDTVDILSLVGRGSPTGVTVYRHYQFPPYFRNGLFAADWAFGKIFFFALEPDGATFRSRPELFLEPIGTHGFAPNDLAVGMDGSLFVSVGGRKTRGGVYRIEADAGAENLPANKFGIRMPAVSNELEGILRIPQPLDAWSRAIWLPIAVRLGPGPVTQAAVNRALDAPLRVRAIEILTEGFKGLSPLAARALAADPAPAVRARAAWSLGRYPPENFGPLLVTLAQDPQAFVRRSALEAMLDRVRQLSAPNLIAACTRNFGHRDKRVRQIAARLATELPDGAWTGWLTNATNLAAQARLTVALAQAWRRGPAQPPSDRVNPALSVLSANGDADLRLQALRLIMLALGDFNLESPSVEVHSAFEPAANEIQPAIRAAIATAVRPLLPSGDWRVDAEAARLLAMIKDADTNSARKMIAYLTPAATATSDFHYLTVLSRLPAKLLPDEVGKIAAAVLNLDVKLAGQQERSKQNWSLRLEELLTRLIQLHPDMPSMLLTHPQFARPNHLNLVAALGPNYRPRAAALFLAAARNPEFPWSGAAVELLSTLPRDQVIPLFRRQWENFAIRDALALRLAPQPDPADRPRFLTALDSMQTNVLGAALAALHRLPRDTHPADWLHVLGLLRRLFSEPDSKSLRAQAVALLVRDSGQPFALSETGTDPPALARAYEPVFAWFRLKYPPLAAQLDADTNDVETWRQTLRATPFDQGNAGRGQIVFRERGCLTCHAGASALGPDLAGVADRFSLEDVFNAIIFPNRDVAPLYRTSRFRLKDGQVFTGIVAFESADGVILQTGATTTVRLAALDIVERQPATVSLMPNGLLAGLAPRDIADLYAYLKAWSRPGR